MLVVIQTLELWLIWWQVCLPFISASGVQILVLELKLANLLLGHAVQGIAVVNCCFHIYHSAAILFNALRTKSWEEVCNKFYEAVALLYQDLNGISVERRVYLSEFG